MINKISNPLIMKLTEEIEHIIRYIGPDEREEFLSLELREDELETLLKEIDDTFEKDKKLKK